MLQRSLSTLKQCAGVGSKAVFSNSRSVGTKSLAMSRTITQHAKISKCLYLVLRHYSAAPIGSSLIPTVNKLQEIFAMTGTELDLPQLVVVGSQSSGKSSVLENLVGRDFLPRGSGIVTRRPLILQLTQVQGETEWGEFTHKPTVKYYQFEQIRNEISAETDKIAGKNLGVIDKPILLKIFSPHVINLTLFDLPGIARNPVGDQPKDIEAQIIKMIRKYAEKPNAIILAVHPANVDLATSDAVKLATQVDPSHGRTVGVLTKLDLMDRGTNALNILNGREMPLTHGWVPILSRSQEDIARNKSIAAALRDEGVWFQNHEIYAPIAERTGTTFLANKCNKLLTEHIRKTLPELKSVISQRIKACKAELEMYGEPVPKEPSVAGPHLLSLFAKFSQSFKDVMDGSTTEIQTHDLNGGARIRFILNEDFSSKLQDITPTSGLSTSDIRMAIRNAAGTKSALLVPDQAFEQLVKRQIALFKEPALETASLIYNELALILATMECSDVIRYRRLREKITEVTTKALKSRLKEVNQLIDTMVQLEVGFINTSHPDFLGVNVLNDRRDDRRDRELNAVLDRASSSSKDGSSSSGIFGFLFGGPKKSSDSKPSTQHQPSQHQASPTSSTSTRSSIHLRLDDKAMSEHERVQVKTIVSLLDSYLRISQKSIQDTVIKVIMCKLVNETREVLQRELTAALYHQHMFGDLLRESEDIDAKRIAAKEQLLRLREAKRVIQTTDDAIYYDDPYKL